MKKQKSVLKTGIPDAHSKNEMFIKFSNSKIENIIKSSILSWYTLFEFQYVK